MSLRRTIITRTHLFTQGKDIAKVTNRLIRKLNATLDKKFKAERKLSDLFNQSKTGLKSARGRFIGEILRDKKALEAGLRVTNSVLRYDKKQSLIIGALRGLNKERKGFIRRFLSGQHRQILGKQIRTPKR